MKRIVKAAAVATGISVGVFGFAKADKREANYSPELSAELHSPAIVSPENLKVTLPTVVKAIVLPKTLDREGAEAHDVIQSKLILRLGEFGLSLVAAEEGVNEPDEFMVSVNQHCGSQFEVSNSLKEPGYLNITSTVFGRLSILKRFTKLAGFPEFDGLLQHQDTGVEGPDFDPNNVVSVAAAVQYVSDTTHFVCKNAGLEL